MSYSIAIDGPAGAGKSTVAREAARRLGCVYVDTGAMYRAMALYTLRCGIDAEDGAAVCAKCREADIEIRYENGEQVVYLNGENVNGLIRTEAVGNRTSRVAVYPDVRRKMVELQQKIARNSDVVMDGRDIGTCVLPDATVKIYLTASSAVRAKRRCEELRQKGEDCDLASIEADIIQRDRQDMTREVSPLARAADAVLVDSSDMDIEQVTEAVITLCRQKGCL